MSDVSATNSGSTSPGSGPGPDANIGKQPPHIRTSDVDVDDDGNSLCESDDDYLARCEVAAAAAAAANSASSLSAAHATNSTVEADIEHRRQPSIVGQTEGHVAYSATATTSTPLRTFSAERMRRKLQFFFMNPIEKWQTRRRFPYKFLVQLVKLVLVSIQLCLFAHSR